MNEPGRLLAAGRDAEIFEFGPGRVLRRARDRRSLEGEARIMEHVRAKGFPVPAIHEVRSNGTEVVMERVDGPSMLDALGQRPWQLWHHARSLAALHDRLHAIRAPDWLPVEALAGETIVHLDLHPLNVLMTDSGPVVIDWANAAAGDPALDLADAWLLLACAGVGGDAGVRGRLMSAFRGLLVQAFLRNVDRRAAARALEAAFHRRASDPNIAAAERAAMRRLALREAPPA
jgi:aminoglycoside phosphotransferase (APT) family kinase protein